jgi:DNA helicase II / ATP-dependent DNA helicase PcrA
MLKKVWNHMLNNQQQKAATLTKGRILVLAGAGTGKTKVITHRIAHLVNDLKTEPKSILGLTFTNKAANEMKQRLAGLIGQQKSKDVFLSTFHSFCLTILRKEADKIGYSKNFSIYDEKDMQRLILQLLKDHNQDTSDVSPAIISETVSEIKNKNIPLLEFSYKNEESKNLINNLYPKIDLSLKTYNAMDLDSILTLTVELFNKSPETLKKYQDIYKYILIDEFQDTNPTQNQIAEKLSEKHKNLFVVGDDDQSIYSWRGSCIKHILDFKADHIVKLEQNYRSTSIILNAANSVIKNNLERHKKSLFSENTYGEKIELFHAPTEIDEAQAVVNRILELKKSKNLNWKNIAILYRSNALSRNIEMALLQATWQKNGEWVKSIPYDIYGGIEFAKRSEIKDLLAYLRLINNLKDQEALLRIINVPRRGISNKTVEILTNYSKENKIPLWNILENIYEDKNDLNLQPKIIQSIKHFVEIILNTKNKFEKNNLAKTFETLVHEINYKKAIEEEVKSEKARQVKWENALECINTLADYEENAQNPTLEDFISTALLFKENIYKKSVSNNDRLQLMTFHSSKGLEFEACFLIGLEDHILPHEKSSMSTSIEEERRLFYVGITRAKKYLTLSMSRTRKRTIKPKPSNPSRFLFEIPKELLKITSWKST